MNQLTRGRSKLLLPIYDRTLAHHACQWILESGVSNIVVVTSPADFADLYPQLSDFHDAGQLQFVFQTRPTGTADALALALPQVQGENVLCLFADNVFEKPLEAAALTPLEDGRDLTAFLVWVSEGLDELAVVVSREEHTSVHRKPHGLTEGWALTGLFLLRVSAFQRFQTYSLRESANGERDLLSYVEHTLDLGLARAERLNQRWVDAASSVESLWRATSLVRDLTQAEKAGSRWR